MKKRKTEKRVTRGAALFLVTMMLLTTLMGSDMVLAYKSLDYIESIKEEKTNTGLPFTIIEVVPAAAENGVGYGSIGYYIKDQEPTAGWRQQIGVMEGKDIRAAYADGIFQKLAELGLLADDASAPLSRAGDYTEQMPWETPKQGAQTVELRTTDGQTRQEQTTLSGTFTFQGKNQGVFDRNSDPTLAVDEAGNGQGTANQSIRYVEYDTQSQAGYYYYAPVFSKLDLENHSPSDYKGQAMYLEAPIDPKQPDGAKFYQYVGILGQDLTLDLSQTYFYLQKSGRPYAQRTDAACYRAETDGFEDVENGYFAMETKSYAYVGSGKGDYTFAAGTAAPVPVFYDTILVSGGYVNNQWFMGKVFDESDTKVKAKVYSLTPGEITDNMLQNADMIVVSAGFNWQNGGSAMVDGYNTNQLTAAQADLIRQAAQDKRPVLLDGRVKDSSQTVLSQLATDLGAGSSGFVSDSVYCFQPDTRRGALASAQFGLPFDAGLWDTEGTPYYAVMKEIEYENFLRARAQMGEDQKLPAEVTMAGCIRYIINFAGQRVENVKTEIHVLEIQPQTQGSELKGHEEKVLEWLPSDCGLTKSDIHVTTMSTAEFIAKIDDINEQYDMVYMGASKEGFQTKTENGKVFTIYNDPQMKGLLYSNIGDRYYSNTKLSGLIDEDYSSGYYDWFTIYDFYNGETTRDFEAAKIKTSASEYRFSGNDITETKKQQLENFAASGFPVILADDLIEPGVAERKESTLSVTASGKIDGGELSLEATATTNPAIAGQITYQWYRGNTKIAGADSAKYETSAQAGVYTCHATLNVDEGYTAISNKITVSNSGFSVGSSGYEYWVEEYPFPVKGATKNNSKSTYTVSYDDIWNKKPSFQWMKYSYISGWQNVSGATSASLTVSDSGSYQCRVTVDGKTYYTQSITRSWLFGWSYSTEDETNTTRYSFSVATQNNQNSVTLTAKMEPTATYRYYLNSSGDAAQEGASHSITVQSGTYYWRVEDKDDATILYSKYYTVKSGLAAVVGTSRVQDAIIPYRAASDYNISTKTIDDSSILYQTLTGIFGRANVMPSAEAKEQKATVLKYLNLSKPTLTLTDAPERYTGVSQLSDSLVKNQTLEFGFQIQNPTDSTPSSTRYTCHLYIDLNADGRYSNSEELTDLMIRDETAGKRISAGELRDKTSYSITRTLPDNFSGIIPWKLEVIKVGADAIHASQTGYTYIKPTKTTTLKILQITYGNFSLATNTKYQDLFDDLRQKGIYDIQVTGRSISYFNNMSRAQVTEEFNKYDMLILGFGDGYGYGQKWGGLSLNAANAVVDYIDSGKAVLFTHDTTSYANLPVSNYQDTGDSTDIYNGQWHWAYYFNSVIRDAVGLDRYGVTSPEYGITKFSPLPQNGGLVADGYAGLNETKAAELKNAGYSIAYQPKTARGSTVYSTQGFTSLTMLRFSQDGTQYTMNKNIQVHWNDEGGLSESAYGTSSVTQTNKGQITTYPYNLNQETMSVANTHEQYYQLNMNSNDIVVWYCLGGSNYANMKNDAVNGYYIYNKGNVTYSGAGHNPDNVTEDEAELFVNTMIAAYRAGAEAAKVEFKSDSGQTVTSRYLPAEYTDSQSFKGTILAGDDEKSAERELAFMINDPNLSASKAVSVKFYYENPYDAEVNLSEGVTVNASEVMHPQLYLADGTPVADQNLSSNTMYKIYLPQEVLDAFGESEKGTMQFYVQVNTVIGKKTYSGSATMELRKLGLLQLK